VSVFLTAFSLELMKSAEEKKEQRPSYLHSMVAGIPVLTGQALSDIPEGAIEGTIEHSIRNKKFTPRVDVGALRFGSRMAAGLGTTPVFLSGMHDITNAKSKKDEHVGMAKLVAAGGAYAGARGAIESKFSKDIAKNPKSWRYVAARTGMGVGGAALTGLTVGRALRHEKKEPTFRKKYVEPALVGAGLSSGKALIEEVALEGGKALRTAEGRRGVVGKAVGKAGAGAVGTLLLSEIMRRALKPKSGKEKKSAASMGPTAELNSQTDDWAKKASTEELLKFYKELELRGGERSPSARAAFYPLHDELSKRGVSLPKLKERENTTGLVRAPNRSSLVAPAALLLTPTLAYSALTTLPLTDRDRVLTDALDRTYVQGKINVVRHSNDGILLRRGDGFAIPDTETIGVAAETDPAEFAHEIGHVRRGDIRGRTIGHAGTVVISRISNAAVAFLSLGILATTFDRSFATKEELESKSRAVAAIGVVGAALSSPVLAEEAMASVKATKYLSSAGASTSEIAGKVVKNLGPAFATYAAPVALPFLIARMLKKRSQAEPEKA